MKVLINGNYGGFSLSSEMMDWLDANGGKHLTGTADGYQDCDYLWNEGKCELRADPLLIKAFEKFGPYGYLKIIEIPDGVDFEIGEYDGAEWVQEKCRKWF